MRARYLERVGTLHAETRPGSIAGLISKLRQRHVDPDRLQQSGEEGAWVNSLPVLTDVLCQAGLGDAWIALEYNPFQAGTARADAVVLGLKDDLPVVLVIELKQWSRASWDPVAQRATKFGARYGTSHHPYRQARDYADFIEHYTDGFHTEQAAVHACAFLHNASTTSIRELATAGPAEAKHTFAGDNDGRARFQGFVRAVLDPDDGESTARELEHAVFHQGPELLEAAAELFQDPDAFPLTPQQREVVHEIQAVIRQVRDPASDRERAIIVVNGKPGSGKTMICTHLLGLNAAARYQTSLATNSGSLRNALSKVARRDLATRHLGGMITSARSFWQDSLWGTQDLLIVDEAQRILEYTVRTGFANRRDIQKDLEKRQITQLFELAKTAKILVLMIDESQACTATDHLTVADAKAMADRVGASFQVHQLTEQHRSSGSKAFEEWVDDLVDGIPRPWRSDGKFTVEVADSPQDMDDRLSRLQQAAPGESSPRIVAGFCWPWSTSSKKNPYARLDDVPKDIVIGDWARRWNLDRPLDGCPGKDDWASNPAGAEQVGSVFTAQGFEFDTYGVILGPDLVAREPNEPLTVNPDASHYSRLVRDCRKDPALLQRFRNQYRVLLTRGKTGVVLYSTDPQTQRLLRDLVPPI